PIAFGPGATTGAGATAAPFAVGTRRVIQRSKLPTPPGRSEANTRIVPSADKLGCISLASLLIGGPRFTAVPNGTWGVGRTLRNRSLILIAGEKISARPSAENVFP